MILDYILLLVLIVATAVFTVYLSIWAEENKLRFRHFLIQLGLFAFTVAQALSL